MVSQEAARKREAGLHLCVSIHMESVYVHILRVYIYIYVCRYLCTCTNTSLFVCTYVYTHVTRYLDSEPTHILTGSTKGINLIIRKRNQVPLQYPTLASLKHYGGSGSKSGPVRIASAVTLRGLGLRA